MDTEGLSRDTNRADLYEQSFKETVAPQAINNQAVLIAGWEDGVVRDMSRAVKLYSQAAVEENGDCYIVMYNLAYLLKNGSKGAERDNSRVAKL